MSQPRSYTIGILAATSESPFHTPLIEAISQEVIRIGAHLVYVQGSAQEMLRTRVGHARADAWLIVNVAEAATQLAALGRPVLLICAYDGDLPSVQPDNRTGALAAVQHLLNQGHTRIAFIGTQINHDFRERLVIYREQLEAHGIAYDPDLVLNPGGYDIFECYDVMAALLARGIVPTAVFGANDWAAMGAIQAVQASGRHVPNDVAVVGFDDMPEAAYYHPPLSSVRQRPDQIGRVALHLLIDQLDSGTPPPSVTRVATHLIARQSSGGATTALRDTDADRYTGMDWQPRLMDDLVQLLLEPNQPDPALSAEQIWPGVAQLTECLDAAAGGRTPAPLDDAVWATAIQLAHGAVDVQPVLARLHTAGFQRARVHGVPHALETLSELLVAFHQAIAAHVETRLAQQVERQKRAAITDTAMLRHFNSNSVSPTQLTWAEVSWADWALIGLLEQPERTNPASATLLLTAVYERGRGVEPLQRRIRATDFPPLDLLPVQLSGSSAYILKISPIRTQEREWGYIATYERHYSAGYDTIESRNTYIATLLEREVLLTALTERQQHLQVAYERERSLSDTIRELGCPLIPILPGVLLVPLIGVLDEQRTQQIIEQVLSGVSREQANQVLLDITGVPLVDTHVAAVLIQTTQAVALLGAQVTLVGVRPEIAQSIVSLNIDLAMIETRPTLAAAIQTILQRKRATSTNR